MFLSMYFEVLFIFVWGVGIGFWVLFGGEVSVCDCGDLMLDCGLGIVYFSYLLFIDGGGEFSDIWLAGEFEVKE